MQHLTQTVFKRRHRLTTAAFNQLLKKKIVKIQQSGYRAHSQCHNKLIIVRDPELLKLSLKEQIEIKECDPEPRQHPKPRRETGSWVFSTRARWCDLPENEPDQPWWFVEEVCRSL